MTTRNDNANGKKKLPPDTMLGGHFGVRRSVSESALLSCINTTPTLFPGWVGFFTISRVSGCSIYSNCIIYIVFMVY